MEIVKALYKEVREHWEILDLNDITDYAYPLNEEEYYAPNHHSM